MGKPRRDRSTLWKRSFSSFKLPPAELNSAIKSFYESIDTPVSLACWLQYEAKELSDLVHREIHPQDYNSVDEFRNDYMAISFLKKSQFLKTGIDTKAKALESFKEAEESCSITNRRFSNLGLDPLFKGPNVWLLNAVTRKIQFLLRDVTISDKFVDELLDGGAFGPGSSTLIRGKDTSSVRKFREERQITELLYRVIEPLLKGAYPLWYKEGSLSKVEFRNSSKVITVPKNAKIDRTIAIEPGLNVWFQLSIGKMIRRRLRIGGLELNSSDRNSAYAKVSSKDDSLATVDFSSASDMISKRMIEEILPPLWFNLLDSARSASYELDNRIRTFEKFSSMGNGFTFELESLVFYAAALCCTEYLHLNTSRVSVFGDDVILPSQAFDLFEEFCSFLGFRVNRSKSYSSGPFRESCGSYYFNGVDVKPLFLKKDPSYAANFFIFANSLRLLSHRCCNFSACDGRFRELFNHLIEYLPQSLRLRGDTSGGGGCIHSNFDESTPTVVGNGWEGYTFSSLVFTAVNITTDSPALLIARLGSRSIEQALGNEYSLRSVTKVRKKRIFTSQWYNFGPWVA